MKTNRYVVSMNSEENTKKSKAYYMSRYCFSISNLVKVIKNTMLESVIYQIWIIYVQTDMYSHEEKDNIRKEKSLEKCKQSCYHETKIRQQFV